MTVEDVKERVEGIRDRRNDDATAHQAEDQLYLDLLTAISNGECDDPVACCKLAITVKDIQFARWYE